MLIIADLKPGDHLCCLYETEEEHQALITPFLRQGLDRGEKIVYIADSHSKNNILDYLKKVGIKVDPYMASEQLSVLTANEAYFQEERFGSEGMIAMLRSETERAIAQGYSALRITCEMSWALQGLIVSEQLIEYESQLNAFISGSKCLVMCQYDQRQFDPALLLDVLTTHPIIALGSGVYDNFYYVPPKDLTEQEQLSLTLQRCLDNLTKRKWAEEALKESEERYQDLIEFANVGIIVSDGGTITQVNIRAEEIYGYSKEELIDQSPNILTLEKYRKQHKEMLDEILSWGNAKKTIFEEEGMKKDGSIFPVEISFSLTQTGKDTIIAVMRDITERKEMEHRLIQSEKLRSLGELSGGVAHDFNNVLAAILGRAQLLKMSIGPSRGEKERRKSVRDLNKSLGTIEKAALDGAETVKRIQEFSQREIDDEGFTQVRINELLQSALRFTRVRWKNESESKGIKIKIKKELSPLPPITGSTSKLREVFISLISNAIDALPQGGQIKIKSSKKGSYIFVIVEDTGIGIPETIRDRIFDPFFTTKGVQSTGLGLSASYGIIARHQGTISVESQEGKGATFTIEIPLRNQEEIKESKVRGITKAKKRKKATILIIEDEREIRALLSDILTSDGHTVEVASGGQEGVMIFKKWSFDLVFTDLGMPGMSGWQVSEKIKRINSKVPVALITGWDVKLKQSEIRASGVDFVIKKPFEIKQVLRLVQEGMILREKFS